jgi:hypothetical protein
MKYLIIVFIVTLVGCEGGNHVGDRTSVYDTACINGVKYYRRGPSLAPAYDRSGNVVLCEEEEEVNKCNHK